MDEFFTVQIDQQKMQVDQQQMQVDINLSDLDDLTSRFEKVSSCGSAVQGSQGRRDGEQVFVLDIK